MTAVCWIDRYLSMGGRGIYPEGIEKHTGCPDGYLIRTWVTKEAKISTLSSPGDQGPTWRSCLNNEPLDDPVVIAERAMPGRDSVSLRVLCALRGEEKTRWA
jgi:hypothetical protein